MRQTEVLQTGKSLGFALGCSSKVSGSWRPAPERLPAGLRSSSSSPPAPWARPALNSRYSADGLAGERRGTG